MATDIRVPTLGESVSEATIAKWFKKPGDAVKADEPLLELETDKVTLEVPAPAVCRKQQAPERRPLPALRPEQARPVRGRRPSARPPAWRAPRRPRRPR